jgi:hypothetical protein
VAPPETKIDPGTEADPVLDESVTVTPPAGTAGLNVSVNISLAVPVIVLLDGYNASAPATSTVWLTGANPVAVAVIVTEPNATPLTFGCVESVLPAGINMFVGLTVAFDGSLLVRVIITAFACAVARETGKETV